LWRSVIGVCLARQLIGMVILASAGDFMRLPLALHFSLARFA
jgi:hypothetical protein